MATDEILRLHYYERQYLGAADLEDQQTYLRDMRRRHNVGHHTWGIVTGLDLTEVPVAGDPTAVDIFIMPGMAIDGFGREIIVMTPAKLDSTLFSSFAVPGPVAHSLWIKYEQQDVQQPAAGFAQCDVTNQFARVLETFNFEVDPKQPTNQDVSVNGKLVDPTNDPTIPKDQSVPYQELPDDTTDPLWLIQLGSVLWDGGQRKFVPANPKSLYTLGRSYVGIVAQAIYDPSPVPVVDPNKPDPTTDLPQFFIQPRFPVTNPDATGFADIIGRLQVEGRITSKKDILLWGGKLQFLDQGGQDDKVPLWIERLTNSGGGTDLRVHIGPDGGDSERLSIGTGPDDGTAEKDILAVRGSNNVDITTGFLNFDPPGATLRQMLNLWKLNYGIGVQSGNLYYRSDSGFRWYQGGKHANDPSSGDNGTLLLSVDGNGSLSVTKDINLPGNINFGTQTRQMLNLWDIRYGIGVQASTLYFRTDTDFCWFRGGSHSNNRDDPGGGVLAMILDSNSKLTVSGDLATQGNLSVSGTAVMNGSLIVDQANVNNGTISPGLTFGLTSGEGIASKRTPGGNQFGLDFYSASISRMSISNGGRVGIGTTAPVEQLDVRGNIKLGTGNLFATGSVENLAMLRGTIDSAGGIQAGAGFTVNKVAAGAYEITFNQAFTSRPSASVTQVFPNPDDFGVGGDSRDNAVIDGLNTQKMKVITGDNTGAHGDRGFTFIIVGPR